jgi:hypothetical protein
MSWLSDAIEAIGGSGGAGGSSSSIWPSIIDAGTSLAGTYFTLQGNKQANDDSIALEKEKLAAQLALAASAGGGGGGGGSGLAIAKMNNLANLYQNWGALAQKGGETMSQAALGTGRLATDPITARLQVLK